MPNTKTLKLWKSANGNMYYLYLCFSYTEMLSAGMLLDKDRRSSRKDILLEQAVYKDNLKKLMGHISM